MLDNKHHWYDGKFYDKFIAPNQDSITRIIGSMIGENCRLVDIGCGTGRMILKLADKCERLVGVDLSMKNISVALSKLNQANKNNLEFIHGNAGDLSGQIKERFDFATLSYVIHEMPEEERIQVLNEAKKIADKLIIADYLVPVPPGIWKLVNQLVEFFAGKDHFKNYKNFKTNGGLTGLIAKTGLTITKEIKNTPVSSHIIMAE